MKRFNSPQPTRLVKKPDHTTSELFGDYHPEPVTKPKPEQFTPSFECKPANVRKNMELYGGDEEKYKGINNLKKEPKEERQAENGNPAKKKMNEQSSNIFNQEPRSIQPPPSNPEKLYPSNSQWTDAAQPRKGPEEDPHPKKNALQKDLVDTQNNDRRKNDRNYSDLFGRETIQSNKASNLKTQTGSNSKTNEGNNSSSIRDAKSPKERKKEEFGSELDSADLKKARGGNYEVKVEKEKEKKFVIDKENTARCLKNLEFESNILPDYKIPYTERNQQASENGMKSEVFDFDIKGLNPGFDENRFSMFCKRNGYHIVSFKSDFNSVLNQCGKSGRLQIRAHNESAISKIKQNLSEFGVEVVPHSEQLGKKNNYLETANVDWKDDNLAKEERRLHPAIKSRNFLSPQHSKMSDLESNGDVFGNSPGVGKWNEEWKNQQISGKKGNGKEKTETKRQSKLLEPVLNSRK